MGSLLTPPLGDARMLGPLQPTAVSVEGRSWRESSMDVAVAGWHLTPLYPLPHSCAALVCAEEADMQYGQGLFQECLVTPASPMCRSGLGGRWSERHCRA